MDPAAAAAQLQARTARALQEAAAQADSAAFSDRLLKIRRALLPLLATACLYPGWVIPAWVAQ